MLKYPNPIRQLCEKIREEDIVPEKYSRWKLIENCIAEPRILRGGTVMKRRFTIHQGKATIYWPYYIFPKGAGCSTADYM